MTHAVALLSSVLAIPTLCDLLRFPDFIKKTEQYAVSDATQTRFFLSNPIFIVELYSILFLVKTGPYINDS